MQQNYYSLNFPANVWVRRQVLTFNSLHSSCLSFLSAGIVDKLYLHGTLKMLSRHSAAVIPPRWDYF